MGNGNQVKTFVIDTNVLIHKSDAILSFRDNEIVIPMWVLEELDKLKTYSDERGRNARAAIRFLDEQSQRGRLDEGVKLENGSTLMVMSAQSTNVPDDLSAEKVDNMILFTAYSLKEQGRRVFFVSKDINARVKAAALGIRAVDYEKQKINIDRLYSGYRELDASDETVEDLTSMEVIPWKEELQPNEFLFLRHKSSDEPVIGRFMAEERQLRFVYDLPGSVYGIKPLNLNQRAALDLLLDDSIRIVTLVGKAGTGKTLLAIAAGLRKVVEEKTYSRVLVTRPIIPMGKDIGYLPGAKEEKLSHWMQPLFDNLEFILSGHKHEKIKNVDALLNGNYIEIEALTYIRGRSLPNQFIIIDEAQNLSPHEIKTIVSRAGEDTKVVMTGDPYQIDSPYLDANSNGLTFLVEAFRGQPLFGHMILEKSERSDLAELAAELL